MAFDTGRHGYTFTRDLCRAIEQYTADAVARNSRAFEHRGLNLRFAVERQLYIDGINSAPLFAWYVATQEGGTVPEPQDGTAARLAGCFPGRAENAPAPEERPAHSRPYLALRWLYGRLRRIRHLRRAAPRGHRSAPVLFHVVHPKFARYLAPVTRRMPEGAYAYLVATDPALATPLAAIGEPMVAWPPAETSLRAALAPDTLQPFPGLLAAADSTLAALRALRPECVVAVEGNAPLDCVTSEACRHLGIKSYCVQQGWSPYVHSGFRNLAFDHMFVWGPAFAELLRPYNPAQSFIVSGSHAVCSRSPDAAVAKPTVISFFLQAPCAFLSSEAYDAFVQLVMDCAVEHPSATFVAREHPSYPVPSKMRRALEALPNVVFSDPARQPMADLVQDSTLVVSVFSTVLLEAMAMRVLPLICSIGSLPRYEPDLAAEGAAIEVFSVSAARSVIRDIVANPAVALQYQEQLGRTSEQFFSSENAAKVIASRLMAHQPNQKSQP